MVHAVRSRAALASVTLLAGAAPIAGCGSTAKTTAATQTKTVRTASTRTTNRPKASVQSPPSRAQALAFVHHVRLHASDLPGFTAKPAPVTHTTLTKQLRSAFSSCLGTPLPHMRLAHSRSPRFESDAGAELIFTTARVWRSETSAVRQLTIARSARAGTCLTRTLTAYLKAGLRKRARIGTLTATRAAPQAPEMTGSFGWNLTVPIEAQGIALAMHASILGFQDGDGEAALTTLGVPEPISKTVQQHLFSLLLARAKASHP